MVTINGLAWPDDVGDAWRHALRHVQGVDRAIRACRQHRTAVQAGGNVGLWPRRLAEHFARVVTFEPDPISRACLERNVPPSVDVRPVALGDMPGTCTVARRGLGSHRIRRGDGDTLIVPLDACALPDVDLIQLDIEGFEWFALLGARQTIARDHPIVQVELREFGTHFGRTNRDVRRLLAAMGYLQIAAPGGSDFVFQWVGK